MKVDLSVDASAVFDMLRQCAPAVEERVYRDASIPTGAYIADEARGRVRRRTGKTADAITSSADDESKTVRVFVGRIPGRSANVPLFLEYGTKFMSASPFLFVSAQLEEGPHLRRVEQALQQAIDEVSR